MKARPRILFLLAIAITGVGTQEVLPQTSRIQLEGKVLRLGTLEPIPGAEVYLVGINLGLPETVTTSTVINAARLLDAAATAETAIQKRLMESTAAGFAQDVRVPPELLRPTFTATASSDPMGNFRFTDLPAGRYSLSVSKEGLFAPSVAGYTSPQVYKMIRLQSATSTAVLNVFMVQGGGISGQVNNSSGPSVGDLMVEANERSFPSGKMTLTLKSSKSLDERGNFRFSGLPPGEYFLSVRPSGSNITGRAGRVPALAYYPSVTEAGAAVPVIVKDGSEISGINIEVANRFTNSQMPTYRISGITVNNSPPNAGNVIDRSVNTFYLVPLVANAAENTPLEFPNAVPEQSRPNGEFEIRNVPPGRYELYSFYRSFVSRAPLVIRVFTSRNVVEVVDTDITNLPVVITPGAALKVEVISTPDAGLGFAALTLGLRVIDSMPATFVSIPRQFDSAGKLTLQNIPEARYALSLAGLPENAYVSDVRQNGTSIYDNGFLLQEGSNPVQILVNRDGGTITSRIRSPRSPGSDITVVLVPPAERRRNAALFKTATVDEDGAFVIRGVAPGTYTLVPLESRPSGEPWLNADFLAKHEGRGQALRITAGSTIRLDLN